MSDVLEALRADIITAMRALLPRAQDPLRFLNDLRAAVADDASVAINAAIAATSLGPAECGAFVRELLVDPRAEVRRGLFEAFAPPHVEQPIPVVKPVPDAELDELLRAGLLDPDGSVRVPAARYAFAAERGGSLVGELMVNLLAPEPELRWWVVLALGQAGDPLSLDQLEQLANADDLTFVSAAVRALAARPDGHARWMAAFDDERAGVRATAVYALSRLVSGVAPEMIAQLAADPREDVQTALVAYRARAA